MVSTIVVEGKKCPTSFRKKDLVDLASKKLKRPASELEKYKMAELCEMIDSAGKKISPKKKVAKSASPKKSKIVLPKGPTKVGCPPGIRRAELVTMAAKKLKVEEKSLAKMNMIQICAAMEGKAAPSPKKPSPKKSTPTKKAKKIKLVLSPYPKLPRSPKPKTPIKISKKTVRKGGCVERSEMKLLPHQLRVVEFMKSHRGLIVAHSVGSGKTLTAVTASQCFLDDHPSGIVKIVTPVSLQSNMKKEMKAAGVDPSDPRYEFYTLHGFSSAHALSSVSSSMTRCGSNTMLIIDEAHELRTDIQVAKRKIVKKSKGKPAGTVPIGIVRADIAVKCAKDAAKVLLLTGTAVYNSPRDMANLVAMVRGEPVLGEKAFERMMASDAAFKKYFSCITSFYENPKDENFPTVKERYVEFEMTPKYYKEYKAVENRTSSLFNAKNPSRFLIGFRQASNALTECIKCEWVLQKAKEGKKMVIFSSFITFGLEKIQEKFKAAKIPFVEVKGSMSKEEREKAVNKYNTDKVNILFITKAGGQGLDLKGTRYFILFEKSWNDATEEQAKGRAARYRSHTHLPKSEQTVEIFHLMMVKPRGNKDRLQSADSILKSLILQKNKEKREFLKRLFPLSIEQMAC